jgi:hypothetical protein
MSNKEINMVKRVDMVKQAGTMILVSVLLCFVLAGCDVLDGVLGNAPNDTQTSGATGSDTTGAAEGGHPEEDSATDAPLVDTGLITDSEWLGIFATDGRNYSISNVSKEGFLFVYTNLYSDSDIREAAVFHSRIGVYEDLIFRLDGDALFVTGSVQAADSDKTGDEDAGAEAAEQPSKDEDEDAVKDPNEGLPEFYGEYWRAFNYKELDPRPLNEEEGMISQKNASKELESSLSDLMKGGMLLQPAGAIEIDGQPCWTFSMGKNINRMFTGQATYAVSREGKVFLRDDYLLQFVIQPYVLIEIES